jgi:transposase
MGRPYSEDLRRRVVAAVEGGLSCSAAPRQFAVSISCAIKLLQRWRRTGSVAPEPRGRKPYALADHDGLVRELVAARPTILGKISKRGNKYLRTLFVQAAHVVLARRPRTAMRGLWPWIEQASKRLHRNMLAIALANKLARIAWAVLARGRAYQPRITADAA